MRATTTALVRDLPISKDDVAVALAASLYAAGYLSDPDDRSAFVTEQVNDLIDLAETFEVGDVIERRLDEIRVRARHT